MNDMTPAQFAVIAELLRSREPVRTAVRMVLIDSATTRHAANETGLVPQSVSNALRRYRAAHEKLITAYLGKQ